MSLSSGPIVCEQRAGAISDIKIGKRHRKDLGDIAGVAANIEGLGLVAWMQVERPPAEDRADRDNDQEIPVDPSRLREIDPDVSRDWSRWSGAP
jgi:hypothetical protein